MFKKSPQSTPKNLFFSPEAFLGEEDLKALNAPLKWHNLFFYWITSLIDEDVFRPLYKSSQYGAPNAAIRRIIAAILLKRYFHFTYRQTLESCRENLVFRRALGLSSVEDAVPKERNCMRFMRRVAVYRQKTGRDLMNECVSRLIVAQIDRLYSRGGMIRDRYNAKVLEFIILFAVKGYLAKVDFEALNRSLKRDLKKFVPKDDDVFARTLLVAEDCDAEEAEAELVRLGKIIRRIFRRLKDHEYSTLRRIYSFTFEFRKRRLAVKREIIDSRE